MSPSMVWLQKLNWSCSRTELKQFFPDKHTHKQTHRHTHTHPTHMTYDQKKGKPAAPLLITSDDHRVDYHRANNRLSARSCVSSWPALAWTPSWAMVPWKQQAASYRRSPFLSSARRRHAPHRRHETAYEPAATCNSSMNHAGTMVNARNKKEQKNEANQIKPVWVRKK